jgi:phosphatidylserine/phosphatidylglycerophosphate/cardiolipin synthase-like enzyme
MKRPFEKLTCADLRALATAARAGRLSQPYSKVAVGRLLDVAVVSETLSDIQGVGLPPEALGPALSLLADEREAAGHERGGVELVWTGPELPGAESRDTLVVVRELFASAESYVLASGFTVAQGKEVFEPLARRMAEVPSLKVQLFLNIARPPGSRESDLSIVQAFVADFRQRNWPSDAPPEIYYDPRSLAEDFRERAVLHAKCIIVDDRHAFVTSANLTTAAQEKNIEAGLLVRNGGLAHRLRMQFEALVAAGVFKLAYRPES